MARYFNPIIYERISNLVKSHDMVMFDLSKQLGISSGNLSDWKIGKSTPSIEKIIAIANFFNVSTDYIVGRDEYVTYSNSERDCIELSNIYINLDREGKLEVMTTAYQQKRRLQNEREKAEAQG